jgi:alkaline phosphatase
MALTRSDARRRKAADFAGPIRGHETWSWSVDMSVKVAFGMVASIALVLGGCAAGAVGTTGPQAAVRVVAVPPQASDSYFVAGARRAAELSRGQRARNVIIFVGDGMGVTTVTAARIFAGQSLGLDGESYNLTMDGAPYSAFSRTYSADMQISESASTATAILSGVKTRGGGVGLTQAAARGSCEEGAANPSQSLLAMAETAGMATGIVSTARITHATPAAAYAHSADRNWENDAVAGRTGGGACADIARQLIEWPVGDGFEVALGGGRSNFLPNTVADPVETGVRGQRLDGRNLPAEWAAKPGHSYVTTAAELAAVGNGAGRKILGLFAASHMAYETDRAATAPTQPDISAMTAAAIRRLQLSETGYVLLVEGGRIDHGHHDGRAAIALREAVAFDAAIKVALDMTSRDDTLIIATADHGHAFSIAGYARRGTPILGLSTRPDGTPVPALDGKPYTTLGYLNGPGAVAPSATGRPDLTGVDTTASTYRQQALVPLESETHSGEDVPVYAWGPNAGAVRGSLEQNVLYHIMADALGLRPRP